MSLLASQNRNYLVFIELKVDFKRYKKVAEPYSNNLKNSCMKNILSLLSLLILLTISGDALAQVNTPSTLPDNNSKIRPKNNEGRPGERVKNLDNWFVGGGFGLQFGTTTLVDLSPLIGYRFTDKISLGAGPTYQYYRQRDPFTNFTVSRSSLGGRAFGRYDIWQNLFAHGEYEYLRFKTDFNGFLQTVDVQRLPVGGGYRQRLGGNSTFNIMVLYDFLYYKYEQYYYSNPIIFRMGVNVGL